ncbi:hypothetical protein NMY22_g2324 [Coprinellus aureogranulatus]|nr:hypothetical protein NMY22_g2324 [Coprinellus aureogranulatus]
MLNISLMENLSSLTIEGTFGSTDPPSALVALPPSLQAFSLRVPASSCTFITSILDLSGSGTVRLRRISFEITCDCDGYCSGPSMPQETLGSKLLPFLRASSLTLEALKLRPCSAVKFDEASLLANESVRRFLASASSVTRLALDAQLPRLLTSMFPSPELDHRQCIPRVQSLHVHLPVGGTYAEPTQPTLSSFGRLTSLIRSQLDSLVELDLGNISLRTAPLSVLRFTIWRLQLQAFVSLSMGLPHLRTLSITYESVQSNQSNDCTSPYSDIWARTNDFLRDMRELHFEEWNLENIIYVPRHPLPDTCWRNTLVEAFPKVKTINGAPKHEYLAWFYEQYNL